MKKFKITKAWTVFDTRGGQPYDNIWLQHMTCKGEAKTRDGYHGRILSALNRARLACPTCNRKFSKSLVDKLNFLFGDLIDDPN